MDSLTVDTYFECQCENFSCESTQCVICLENYAFYIYFYSLTRRNGNNIDNYRLDVFRYTDPNSLENYVVGSKIVKLGCGHIFDHVLLNG